MAVVTLGSSYSDRVDSSSSLLLGTAPILVSGPTLRRPSSDTFDYGSMSLLLGVTPLEVSGPTLKTITFGGETSTTGGGVSNHSLLTGLLNNDHPQYALLNTSNQPFTGQVGINTIDFANNDMFRIHNPSGDYLNIRLTNSTTGTGMNQGFGLSIGIGGSAAIVNYENTDLDIYTNNTRRATFGASGGLSVIGAVTGSNLNIGNWDTSYSWGNHATAGYVPYIGATSNVDLGVYNISTTGTMLGSRIEILSSTSPNNAAITSTTGSFDVSAPGKITLTANNGILDINTNTTLSSITGDIVLSPGSFESVRIDRINENTLGVGTTIENVLIRDGSITLDAGVTVDTIETILTNDHTHIPTSSAVTTAISNAISSTGLVDTIGTPSANQIAVFTDQNTIQGSSDFIYTPGQLSISNSGQIILSSGIADNTISHLKIESGDGASKSQFVTGNNSFLIPIYRNKLMISHYNALNNGHILHNAATHTFSTNNDLLGTQVELTSSSLDVEVPILVDTINEHTLDAGVTIEGVVVENGGITLGTGSTVNTIESILTNDGTHIPTSAAVYAAISGAGGMVYPGIGIAVSTGTAWGTSISDNSTNWDTAYTHSQIITGNPHNIGYADISDFATGVTTNETSHTDVVVDGDFISEGLIKRGATSGSYSIITDNSSNWDSAYSWGNHASVGYEAGLGNPIVDGQILSSTSAGSRSWISMPSTMVYPSAGIPISTGTAWGTSITNNSVNWDSAYSWGDHSTVGYVTGTPWTAEGYLTSFTETDPTVGSHIKSITNTNITNWNTAYTERLRWDGGSTGLTAATGRTSLGATTVGSNIFTLPNPSAIRFLQLNANNSVSTLNAADFLSAIGGGSGNVIKVGTPVDNQIAIWTGDGTIEGNPNLTFDDVVLSSSSIAIPFEDGGNIGKLYIGDTSNYFYAIQQRGIRLNIGDGLTYPGRFTFGAKDGGIYLGMKGSATSDYANLFVDPSQVLLSSDFSSHSTGVPTIIRGSSGGTKKGDVIIEGGSDQLEDVPGGDLFLYGGRGSITGKVYIGTGSSGRNSLAGSGTGTSILYWNRTTGEVTYGDMNSAEMVYPSAGIPVSTGTAWGTSITNNSVNWNTAYSHSQITTGNPHDIGYADINDFSAGVLNYETGHGGLVPYTGATNDLDLGARNLTTTGSISGASLTTNNIQSSPTSALLITATGGTSAGGVSIWGGNVTSGNNNGGSIGLYPGNGFGTGARGDIIIGTGSGGIHPLKTATTSSILYYNTSTGNVTYGTAPVSGAPAYGAATRIPYMNGTSDGFSYSGNLIYNGTNLVITGGIQVSATSTFTNDISLQTGGALRVNDRPIILGTTSDSSIFWESVGADLEIYSTGGINLKSASDTSLYYNGASKLSTTNTGVVIAGGITLNTGGAVDTIETTLTNDDTHLPTSGAIVDYSAPLNATITALTANTTLTSAYNGRIVECTNSITITLPNSMPTGFQVTIVNMGTGSVTINASTTLYTKDSKRRLTDRYAAASYYHRGSNVWVGFGDLNS